MENGRKLAAMSCVVIGQSDYRETILNVIAQQYATKRHAAKILARHAKASYRTAEAWIAGRNVPSGASLMNLMAECEVLADEVMRLVNERKVKLGK